MGKQQEPGGETTSETDAGPASGTTATAGPSHNDPDEPRLRWSRAPRELQLPAGQVQIRAAVLDRSAAGREALGRHLSAEELRGIARLRRPTDQARSLVRRGLLRKFLAGYLDVSPQEVSFRYGAHGKPSVSTPRTENGIRFNLSHSGPLALFAFTRDGEVGVDVEARRSFPDLEGVAARFFSKSEHRRLVALPLEQRTAGFYNAWTRKEAFVKAVGEGLSHPLSDFDVSLRPGRPARLLRLAGDRAAPERWSLTHLEPAPGFVGAVVLRVPHVRVRCWV